MTVPFCTPPVSDAERTAFGTSGTMPRGLRGLPSSVTGIPVCSQLEQWWVEGMNNGYRALPDGERAPWQYPIPNLPWVRSWMLFRLAIIYQGIAARAALGQASSASAKTTRGGFDFYGNRALAAKSEADEAKL